MYKAKLQELCHKQQWGMPQYATMKEGPDHNPRFKSTIFLNRMSFQSSTTCCSSKNAQNEAAKLAFLHFSSQLPTGAELDVEEPNVEQEIQEVQCLHKSMLSGLKEDVSVGYKNLLQEFSQKKNLSVPIYKTTKCGVSHMPTFFSTVEVEQKIYCGSARKCKKDAESNAAKVAYTMLEEQNSDLKECAFNLSPNLVAAQAANLPCGSASEIIADNAEQTSKRYSLKMPRDEIQDKNGAKFSVAKEAFRSECSVQSPSAPNVEGAVGIPDPSLCSDPAESLKESLSPGPPKLMKNSSSLALSDTDTLNSTHTTCYLLCNRVRVYTCFPGTEFPKGITVLPVCENKWVAMSLEYLSEGGN